MQHLPVSVEYGQGHHLHVPVCVLYASLWHLLVNCLFVDVSVCTSPRKVSVA